MHNKANNCSIVHDLGNAYVGSYILAVDITSLWRVKPHSNLALTSQADKSIHVHLVAMQSVLHVYNTV